MTNGNVVLSPQKGTKDRWLTSKKTEQDWKIYLDDFNPQMKETKPIEAIERLRDNYDKEFSKQYTEYKKRMYLNLF